MMLEMYELTQEGDTSPDRRVRKDENSVHKEFISSEILRTLERSYRFSRGAYGHYTQYKRDGSVFWWSVRKSKEGSMYIMLTTWKDKHGTGKRYFIEAEYIDAEADID